MLKYNDVYFQLIDTPPLVSGGYFRKVVGLMRNADGIIIVLDATRDFLGELRELVETLKQEGVLLVKPGGRVVIDVYRTGKSGIRVTLMGKITDGTIDDVRKLLESYRIFNAHVKIYGEVSIDDVEQSLFEATVYKPTIIFINKADLAKPNPSTIEEVKKLLPGVRVLGGFSSNRRGIGRYSTTIIRCLRDYKDLYKSPERSSSRETACTKEKCDSERCC